jgi:uncharacterized membrane protein YheB (UPF0754 family)
VITAASVAVILVVVPLVTAFIGYITNWAAVKMIFHARAVRRRVEDRLAGVLPSKADTFARDVAGNVGTVLSPAELAERLDPAEMEALFEDRLDAELPVIVADVAEMLAPGTWEQMAPEAQQMVITQIRTEGSVRSPRTSSTTCRASATSSSTSSGSCSTCCPAPT